MYKVLDLFCGAGGMAEGFRQAGFDIPFASDYSKEATTTYINRHLQLGHDIKFFRGDISELIMNKNIINFVNNESIDVIVGGPPCQGFSLTGKRISNDPRNRLFMEYLKSIKLLKPKYFVIENVVGILSSKLDHIRGVSGVEYKQEYVTNIITQEVERMGYKLKWKVMNCKNYGVPQNRVRVIFLGYRNEKIDAVVEPQFPAPMPILISVKDAISDLDFLKNGEKSQRYFTEKEITNYQQKSRDGRTPNREGKTVFSERLSNHEATKHSEKTVNRFKLLRNGEKINQLLKRLQEEASLEQLEYYNTKKRSCMKLEADSQSPTILTLPDDIVHYANARILTVRELARLQSFDDSFVFYGKRTTGGDRRKYETPQYTQVGNAVPPLFAKAIASEIMKSLQQTDLRKV